MIIDIRGTHGSGKSTLVRLLLRKYGGGVPILDDYTGEHLGYSLPEINCGVIAKYTQYGGGCDGVKNADEIVRRVRLFAKQFSRVVLEGILVSHTYTRYANLAAEFAPGEYRFLFLNTPLEKCIERVERRRLAKGNTKPLNPKNIKKDYRVVWENLRRRAIAAGLNVQEVNWKQPLPHLLKALEL